MGKKTVRVLLLAGVLALTWGVGSLGQSGSNPRADARPAPQARSAAAAPLPGVAFGPRRALAAVDEPERAIALPEEAFFDLPDAPVRDALANRRILTVEKGRGGRSLGFRILLEGGQKGYFKPEQTFSAANWFGEVASYHLDRMLGLGRVPAVVSRSFAWDTFLAAAGSDARASEIIVRDGRVRGAFVAWVDGPLERMETQERWEQWLRLTHWKTSAVSPFQRASIWAKQVRLQKRFGREWRSQDERTRLRHLHPEPVSADRPAELSDLIVFDYLTRNLDRWGGRNGNVLVRGEKGPLVFLDNGAGFEPGDQLPAVIEARLELVERFRRSTILAIRAFDLDEFEKRLASEAVTPVLSRAQLLAFEARRQALLARVAELQATHGEAIWAWD